MLVSDTFDRRIGQIHHREVLILVLVDVGLGPQWFLGGRALHAVLILVLVDVGLGQAEGTYAFCGEEEVLILVLVDVGLGLHSLRRAGVVY